jgi:hypothetical protein
MSASGLKKLCRQARKILFASPLHCSYAAHLRATLEAATSRVGNVGADGSRRAWPDWTATWCEEN